MLWYVTSPAQVFQIRVEQMRHYLYLIIDIATIFVPFFFSFHPRIKFHKKFKAFIMIQTIIIHSSQTSIRKYYEIIFVKNRAKPIEKI